MVSASSRTSLPVPTRVTVAFSRVRPGLESVAPVACRVRTEPASTVTVPEVVLVPVSSSLPPAARSTPLEVPPVKLPAKVSLSVSRVRVWLFSSTLLFAAVLSRSLTCWSSPSARMPLASSTTLEESVMVWLEPAEVPMVSLAEVTVVWPV